MIKNIHMEGVPQGLDLKQSQKANRKWPIATYNYTSNTRFPGASYHALHPNTAYIYTQHIYIKVVYTIVR